MKTKESFDQQTESDKAFCALMDLWMMLYIEVKRMENERNEADRRLEISRKEDKMANIIFPVAERVYLNTINDKEKVDLLEHYYNVDLDDTANGLVDVLFNGFKHKVGIAIDVGDNVNERIELRKFMRERCEDDE